MLTEGGLPRIIQARLDRSIHECIIGASTRLHDRRHRANTEDHRQQPRGKSTATMKNDANKDRKASNAESDDRNMIQGHMEMGRREEGVHG